MIKSSHLKLKYNRCFNDWFGPNWTCSLIALYYLLYLVHTFVTYILYFVMFSVFFKISNCYKNIEFHIQRSHMKLASSEVIKFCTRRMTKKPHFMYPYKMINLF